MKEIWKNERIKAGFTLGLWIMFIVFILCLSACFSRKKTTVIVKENDIDIEKIVTELLANPISYKITEEKDGKQRVFDVSLKNELYEGYINDESGIIKFKCDKENCYKEFLDHEEKQEEYYFLEDLDIFNIKNIVNNLKKDNNDTYSYMLDTKEYKIILKNKVINRIIIGIPNYKITYDINYNL